jgi:hypothetical protein
LRTEAVGIHLPAAFSLSGSLGKQMDYQDSGDDKTDTPNCRLSVKIA